MELQRLLLNVPRPWRPFTEDLIYALAIVIIAAVVHWLAQRWLAALIARRRLAKSVGYVFRLAVRWGVRLAVALLILQQFGVLGNVWTALGAVAALVAIGFVAVWSVASNLLCTLLILISRPFRMGDEVELPSDELSGTVIDMNLLFTTLEGEEGELVQIPNNLFFQKPVKRRSERAFKERGRTPSRIVELSSPPEAAAEGA